jgi:predicted dehydrogenase
VALMGVSHWHTPFFCEPLRKLDDAKLVAVSDPNQDVVRSVADRCGCAGFTDHRELLVAIRPDFVFALAPHADMPSLGHDLIRAEVGFALEKPCGTTRTQVAELREAAAAGGVFAAVPLAFRNSHLLRAIRGAATGEAFRHLSFRFIAGPPQRYVDNGCEWMLDPGRAGGGCTLNLAVHFFDLFALLTGDRPSVVGATMSNATYGLAVEDYSAVTLSGGGADGVVETGYTVPGPTGSFDFVSVCAAISITSRPPGPMRRVRTAS